MSEIEIIADICCYLANLTIIKHGKIINSAYYVVRMEYFCDLKSCSIKNSKTPLIPKEKMNIVA